MRCFAASGPDERTMRETSLPRQGLSELATSFSPERSEGLASQLVLPVSEKGQPIPRLNLIHRLVKWALKSPAGP